MQTLSRQARINELSSALDAGAYRSDLPFARVDGNDLDKSFKQRAAYYADQNRLDEQFKAAALEAVGLAGHPKAEKAWRLAWDRGHSAGRGEVLLELSELAELLLD